MQVNILISNLSYALNSWPHVLVGLILCVPAPLLMDLLNFYVFQHGADITMGGLPYTSHELFIIRV
jgi:hypothetical protein